MSSSDVSQPHLVSLVLQSKKALQYGEQLCSRAHAVSNASANTAVDVLALDAKVRWITEGIRDQLKLVASVAKSIEEQRAHLQKQVHEWDILRVKHSDSLDAILESLGSQLVPPDFHQSVSADSSLFGSQHSDDEVIDDTEQNANTSGKLGERTLSVSRSPSSTIRAGLQSHVLQEAQKSKSSRDKGRGRHSSVQADRKWWKTLRDFVDDQAIEDVLETIENDRLGLDVIMSKTDQYPETLASTIATLSETLPELSLEPPSLVVERLLGEQDKMSTTMAAHLESLAAHYDQMAAALKDTEAGEVFGEEDLQDMNRDTNELPAIMTELQEGADAVEEQHEKLRVMKQTSRDHITLLRHTLDDLDELGEIMTEMLQNQDNVMTKCEEELNLLHNHLLTLEHLRERFVSYQTAFNKLVLELMRRRQYREAAERIVNGMTRQLESMTEEETQIRNRFNSEYGAHLPEDLCLCVANAPTKWEVVPWSGEATEFLPILEEDIVAQAEKHVKGIAEQEGSPLKDENHTKLLTNIEYSQIDK